MPRRNSKAGGIAKQRRKRGKKSQADAPISNNVHSHPAKRYRR